MCPPKNGVKANLAELKAKLALAKKKRGELLESLLLRPAKMDQYHKKWGIRKSQIRNS